MSNESLTPALQRDLIDHLGQFVSAHKRARVQQVLAQRTRYLAVVLEDIYQPHNASAVLRSCECFGVQDVHIIEQENSFRPSPDIALGAPKWLTLHHYRRSAGESAATCLQALRRQGYRIVATTLRPQSIPLHALDLSQPTALCFGTELQGLSEEAHALADLFVQIPMFGFTQSFNISVTAALFLYDLTTRLRQLPPQTWQLTPAEQQQLTLEWYGRIVDHSEAIIRRYLSVRQGAKELDQFG